MTAVTHALSQHDPVYVLAYYVTAIFASVTASAIAITAAYRRHERAKADKIEELERERREQSDAQAAELRRITAAIIGAPATLDDPTPDPGLIERLSAVEDNVVALRDQVAEVKKEVTPNGGETNRLGDRVKRLEEKYGK